MHGKNFAVARVSDRLSNSENTRTTIRSARECTNPVTAVALDHRKKPAANTHFTSKWSTSQPERIWQLEYVQKNADSKIPS